MKLQKNISKFSVLIFISITFYNCVADAPISSTEQTNIFWPLAPCQSAFWVPDMTSELNQNWITYQYEGNPLSQSGECVFTFEGDSNRKIEIIVLEIHLFGKEVTNPPPCLELYNVKIDGNITLLQKECNDTLSTNALESQSTLTDMNIAVITSTIRYGSFQLRARTVPLNYTPTKISSTTLPVTNNVTNTMPTTTINRTTRISTGTTRMLTNMIGISSIATVTPMTT